MLSSPVQWMKGSHVYQRSRFPCSKIKDAEKEDYTSKSSQVKWNLNRFQIHIHLIVNTCNDSCFETSFFLAILWSPISEAICLTSDFLSSPKGNNTLRKACWDICDKKNVWSFQMSLALNNLTPEQNYEPNSYFIFAYAACKYIIQQIYISKQKLQNIKSKLIYLALTLSLWVIILYH